MMKISLYICLSIVAIVTVLSLCIYLASLWEYIMESTNLHPDKDLLKANNKVQVISSIFSIVGTAIMYILTAVIHYIF